MSKYTSKYAEAIERCYIWSRNAMKALESDMSDREETIETNIGLIHDELRETMERMLCRDMDKYDRELDAPSG